jgi:purine-cytosine permease-like protein
VGQLAGRWTVGQAAGALIWLIMAVMTVLAFVKGHITWAHSTVHGSSLLTAGTEFMTAVGIGWGFSWVAWASDYSRFTRSDVTERRLYWASAIGTYLPMIWLGFSVRRWRAPRRTPIPPSWWRRCSA